MWQLRYARRSSLINMKGSIPPQTQRARSSSKDDAFKQALPFSQTTIWRLGTVLLALITCLLMSASEARAFEILGFSFGRASSMEELHRRIMVNPESAVEELNRQIKEMERMSKSDFAIANLYFLRAMARGRLENPDWDLIGLDCVHAISKLPPTKEYDVHASAAYGYLGISYLKQVPMKADLALQAAKKSEELYQKNVLSLTVQALIAMHRTEYEKAYGFASEATQQDTGSKYIEPLIIQALASARLARNPHEYDEWAAKYAQAAEALQDNRIVKMHDLTAAYDAVGGAMFVDRSTRAVIGANKFLYKILPGQAPLDFAIALYGYDVVHDLDGDTPLSTLKRFNFLIKGIDGLKDFIPLRHATTYSDYLKKKSIEKGLQLTDDYLISLVAEAYETDEEFVRQVAETIALLDKIGRGDVNNLLTLMKESPNLIRATLDTIDLLLDNQDDLTAQLTMIENAIKAHDPQTLSTFVHPDIGFVLGRRPDEMSALRLSPEEVRSLGENKYYFYYSAVAPRHMEGIMAGTLSHILFQGWPAMWRFPQRRPILSRSTQSDPVGMSHAEGAFEFGLGKPYYNMNTHLPAALSDLQNLSGSKYIDNIASLGDLRVYLDGLPEDPKNPQITLPFVPAILPDAWFHFSPKIPFGPESTESLFLSEVPEDVLRSFVSNEWRDRVIMVKNRAMVSGETDWSDEGDETMYFSKIVSYNLMVKDTRGNWFLLYTGHRNYPW